MMKILFVGLGSIGQRHLQNLKKIRKDVELFALKTSNNNEIIKD